MVFVEKGLSLLDKSGRLGYILPHKFFNAQYGEPLRGLIAKGKHLSHVVHFDDQQVFAGATTYTCLLFLERAGRDDFRVVKVNDLLTWRSSGEAIEGEISAKDITGAEWNFNVGKDASLFEKLGKMQVKLGDISHIFVGTQTSADDIFVLDNTRRTGKYIIGRSKALDKDVKVESAITAPFLRGKDIRRYETPEAQASLICPYKIAKDDFKLFTESDLRNNFPLAFDYLKENKDALASREKGKFKGENWYAFGYPKSMILFQLPKLIVPDYNNVASFTFDAKGNFYKTGYGILLDDQISKLSPLYVLSLLNSPLLFKYLQRIGTSLRGGYIRFWTQFIEQLPIRTIDFTKPKDKAQHDRIVSCEPTVHVACSSASASCM